MFLLLQNWKSFNIILNLIKIQYILIKFPDSFKIHVIAAIAACPTTI
jgi:hypothetical protein